MRTQFVIVFSIILTLYGFLNYYVGLRGWQSISKLVPHGYGKIYWVLFTLLATSYFIGRFGERFLPARIGDSLIVLGSYWLAALYYLILLFILFDLLRLAGRLVGILPEGFKQFPPVAGLVIISMVAVIVLYGVWNARNPQVTNYEIDITKQAGEIKQLHVVMVADIHLGRIVNNGRLMGLVDKINELNPDLVLLPGDIIDENISLFVEQRMPDTLLLLKPRYGTYAVLGNHEYIGGHVEEAVLHLKESGVKVLRDDYVKIEDSFYIVGRDDRSGNRFRGQQRKELSAVMEGVDRSLPIFLLDHQPYNLEEGQGQGVDLQVSGHTHLGQLYPNNFITRRMFEIDWGHLQKGDFNVIVSCGFGTWGPPIRVGNRPEIASITVNFK